MNKPRGVYTALITPFDQNDKLDKDGLQQLIQLQLQAGVAGIVALGTTGEDPTLNPNEKELVISITRKAINKKNASLIVGTGSYSTSQTIANTLKAESLGADAALIITPYYNRPTQEGLYRHFKSIADATTLPIIVYNIQSRTGQNLQTETLRRLAEIPTIIGVKEASGNIGQISEVIETLRRDRPDFSILSGDDALTLPLIALGGDGIISVVSNLIPNEVKALCDAALSGDFNLARQLHYKLSPLFRAASIETNPIPIKAAMQFCGLPAGKCRLPLCDLSKENADKLKQVIRMKGEG